MSAICRPAIASTSALQTQHARPTSASTTDLEDIERTTIERVFEQVKGDKVLAGKMLGISRATLYRKLKRYQLAHVLRWRQEARHLQ